MNALLLLGFFLNALISAFIGLGGGTFYLLLLDLFEVNYIVLPFIALSCNICVSGTGVLVRVHKKQKVNLRFLAFILIPSMLGTYVGGQFTLKEQSFKLLLSTAVFCILAFSLSVSKERSTRHSLLNSSTGVRSKKIYVLFFVSAGIGLLSGIIGIGGGIVLGPVLYFLGMSYLKIPMITGIYIFVNSLVGLASHTFKFVSNANFDGKLHAFEHLVLLLKPYSLLLVICFCSSLIALYFPKKIQKAKFIKTVVICVTMSIALYNLLRALVVYAHV